MAVKEREKTRRDAKMRKKSEQSKKDHWFAFQKRGKGGKKSGD